MGVWAGWVGSRGANVSTERKWMLDWRRGRQRISSVFFEVL